MTSLFIGLALEWWVKRPGWERVTFPPFVEAKDGAPEVLWSGEENG